MDETEHLVGWWQRADACDATAAQSGMMKKSQGSLGRKEPVQEIFTLS